LWKQLTHRYAERLNYSFRLATSKAVQQYPTVVAEGYIQAGVRIVMARTPGYIAHSRLLNGVEPVQYVMDSISYAGAHSPDPTNASRAAA